MARKPHGSVDQRKPGTELLPVPNYGHAKPRELIDQAGGIERICTIFRAPEDLVRQWYSGEADPAAAAWIALFWQSAHGFKLAFSESHWTHNYNTFLKNEARGRVALLERAIASAGLPVPPGRLTTAEETLLAGPETGHFLNMGETTKFRERLEARVAALPDRLTGPANVPAAPLSRPAEPLFQRRY